jgi:hypothetical protein
MVTLHTQFILLDTSKLSQQVDGMSDGRLALVFEKEVVFDIRYGCDILHYSNAYNSRSR